MKIFFFRTNGGFFFSVQELRYVGGELGVVLEEEPVGGVRVDLQPGLRDQAGEQVGVARQDHRVAVAVGDEHRHLDGAQPLERRGVRDGPGGRPPQGDLLDDKAADGEPEQVYLAEPERGDEGDRVPRHLLDRVAVMPAEPPTPALSKVITRRNRASASTSAGSQESRLPRKCWSSTSGTAPS